MRERTAKEKIDRAIELGRKAAMAGDPDFASNEARESLTDVLTNLRHWASSAGVSWYAAIAMSDGHFHAEATEARHEKEETR